MSEKNQTNNETTSETTEHSTSLKWNEILVELFKGVPVSMTITVLCVVLFVATAIKDKSIFSFSVPALISMGGAHNISIFKGEYWRLITAAFLHDGILHIFCNLLLLFMLGGYTEVIYGKVRYAILIMVSAFVAECFSFYMKSDHIVVSVGLSGALLGMIAAFFAFGALNRDANVRKAFLSLQFLFFIALAIIGGSGDNVNIASHFFGFIVGLLLLLPFNYVKNYLQNEKAASFIFYFLASALVLLGAFVVSKTPRDVYRYHTLLNGIITEHEQMVIEWNQWNGVPYAETRPKAMQHINRMNHFISLLKSETPPLRIEQQMQKDTKIYSQILSADIEYLYMIFREPTYQIEMPQDSFDRNRHFRDSLFSEYWNH